MYSAVHTAEEAVIAFAQTDYVRDTKAYFEYAYYDIEFLKRRRFSHIII